MSKSISLKILGLKVVKLDCIFIKLHLDLIKKARNELDRACGLSLVLITSRLMKNLHYWIGFIKAIAKVAKQPKGNILFKMLYF